MTSSASPSSPSPSRRRTSRRPASGRAVHSHLRGRPALRRSAWVRPSPSPPCSSPSPVAPGPTSTTAMLDGSIRNPGRWGLTARRVGAHPARRSGHDRQRPGRPRQHRPRGATRHRRRASPPTSGTRMVGPGPLALVVTLVVGDRRRRHLGRHRRRTALLAQRARGADDAAPHGRRGQPHGLRPAQPLPAARPGRRPGQPQPGERAAPGRHPHPADHRVRQRVPVSVFLAVALALVRVAHPRAFRRGLPAADARPQPAHGAAAPACPSDATALGAMLVSGGFAGLAGGVMLAGGDFGNYQLVANFGAGIGFAGLLAALVARQRVLVLIFVAFVFGGLRTGSGLPALDGRVGSHRRCRAGLARAGPAAATRDPVRPRAPAGARRHELRGPDDGRLPRPRWPTSSPTRALTATR